MLVLYRITSIASTNPSPIYQDDKNQLNELCLESFLKAFSDIDLKIIFLADHCDSECIEMIQEFSPESEIIESEHGINQAMIASYELAQEADDYVLFQECDYMYEEKVGKMFLQALESLKLVSPYDHPNFYVDRELHSNECKVELVNNHHFRTTERNTMTWGCHSDLVKENLDILKHHGYLDGPVWHDLKERGYDLWVPIPSLATHMVKDYLAPGWKL